jgi:phthalate 4,5-dioxygenase
MLTQEKNALLTQVGPGTPCGELLRRYWQPAALSEELPPGGAPLPVRLLGEDLVLFRDDQGRPGLLGLHCSHRAADLSYGRIEDGGLRCIYHGWLYDIHGTCLDQPGEAPDSDFKSKIHHPAYPCLERAGVVFAYLGPGEPPLLPNYECLVAPDDHVFATKIYSECSYLQGNEGNVDLLHVSFLHYSSRDVQVSADNNRPNSAGSESSISSRGGAPYLERCEAYETKFGLQVCKIRYLDEDRNYIRVGTFIYPNLSAFPAGGLNWHVPIDDMHHWKYVISFDRERPYDRDLLRRNRDRLAPPPEYKPIPNQRNRFLQKRETMRFLSYSGIDMNYFAAQDLCATEGAGAIQDRTQEHLAPSDAPIAMARNLLFKAIRDIEEGVDPPHVIREPADNDLSDLVATYGIIPSTLDWKEHCQRLAAEGRGWVGRPDYGGVVRRGAVTSLT